MNKANRLRMRDSRANCDPDIYFFPVRGARIHGHPKLMLALSYSDARR